MVNDSIARLAAELADRYAIERELGSGGMATVYLARDLRHGRRVAVKILRPELAAAIGGGRFLSEIKTTANLQHPHILGLIDSGEAAGLLYYVMPFVEGESLRERLDREKQLPIAEGIRIATEVASALDYAHRHGVIHRDVKPENILLHDGSALVADFWIALAATKAGGTRLTETGVSVGTPSYMSPEQVSAERELDARTDVHALGAVTYEMLTGEPPFAGATMQAVFAKLMTETPKPPSVLRKSVPQALEAAVMRALEKLPADRFESAAEFADAIGAKPATLPPGAVGPAPRARWNRLLLGALWAASLAAAYVLARRPLSTTTLAPTRRWNITLPQSAPVALQGPSLALGWPTSIALSPGGDQLAYAAPRGNSTILAVRPLDGDSVMLVPGTEGAYLPFFSPDRKWIGFFSGNLLRKVSASGGSPVTLTQVDRITGASWVSNDRILVLENEGFDLRWISASGAVADSTVNLATQFGTPEMLEGGAWAVGQLSSGQLALLSLADGTEMAITRRGVLPMTAVRQSDLLFGTSPHWLKSGYLVYAAGDGMLMAVPFDGARRRVLGEPAPLMSGVRMESGFGYGE
ncbi:MAG: protein kinase domain-containing protein, partial [Candidatus Eiseniibacteriota bacterium]